MKKKLPLAMSMDMHLHSNYSDASENTIDIITDKFKQLEMGACICDHNEIRGSIELFERGEICTIPSIEIGSLERLEFLLYFPTPGDLEDYYIRNVEPYKKSRYFAKLDRSFEELIPAAKEFHAAVGLPHPFAPSWKNINHGRKRKAKLFAQKFFSNIDLVEVINGHLTQKRNKKAFILAEMLEKSPIAGSDSHLLDTLGSVFCQFNQSLSYLEILQILTEGIQVGMNQKFSAKTTAKTGRDMIRTHLKLFISRKDQKRWMVKYEATG